MASVLRRKWPRVPTSCLYLRKSAEFESKMINPWLHRSCKIGVSSHSWQLSSLLKNFSSDAQGSLWLNDIKHSSTRIINTESPKLKPHDDELVFGQSISDHMLVLEWNADFGWSEPVIKPHENFLLDPSASVLHYGSEIYEGLKAYRGADGKIRLFRPMENLKRFWNSAKRMALPTFDKSELYKCMVELVKLDQDWVPKSQSCSLYIRPTLIGTEPSLGVKVPSSAMLFIITCPVGPYFKSGTFNPVSLLADEKYIRSWPGGVGEVKAGGNYGATVYIQGQAEKQGCNQVLWLFNDQVTEVGTMNLFMYWTNENGVEELITPPLDGLTLSGITRKSILELARSWGDFRVTEAKFTMQDLAKASRESRIKEIFGSGTACMVCPVNSILYKGEQLNIPTMENGPDLTKRFYQELNDIQNVTLPKVLSSHGILEALRNLKALQQIELSSERFDFSLPLSM